MENQQNQNGVQPMEEDGHNAQAHNAQAGIQFQAMDDAQRNHMFLWMQNNIHQLQMRLAQAENRHQLGAQAVPLEAAPAQPVPILPPDDIRLRGDQLLKILRNAPTFEAKANESWRMFEFKFDNWRHVSRLNLYATEDDKKRALLQCLQGNAMRALELHGENSTAFTTSRTLEEYMGHIRNIFSPVAEKELARATFKARKQKSTEPPSVYFSEKLALYMQMQRDTPMDFEVFREEMTNGLVSKHLQSRIIESEARDDRQLLNDLMKYTAQGQAKFKAGCPDVVSLDGLALTTQFTRNELEDEEGMEIDKINGKETRKCYNCQTIGHLAKDCRKAKRDKTEKKDMACNYCQKKGHFERECYKKKREQQDKGEKFKKKGGIKNTKEDDEEDEDSEALAIEYEEAEDISRIQEKLTRSRRAQYERSREKEDFLVPSGKRGTH